MANKEFIEKILKEKRDMLDEVFLDIEYLETYKKDEIEADIDVARQQLEEENQKGDEKNVDLVNDLVRIINHAKFTKQEYHLKKQIVGDLTNYIMMLSNKLNG